MRINAEDPARNFMPAPGTVSDLRVPGGQGVRFDTMLYSGYTMPPFYNSLLGKLIVWDETGTPRIARLKRALHELEIGGLQTTKPLAPALAADPAVVAARFHTRWLERWLEQNGTRLAEAGSEQAREVALMKIRYSFGGDEHIFVEVDEEMSLEAFFKSLSMTNAVRDSKIKGVTEICPANASFQIKFDPDVIKPGRHAGRAEEDSSRARRRRTR